MAGREAKQKQLQVVTAKEEYRKILQFLKRIHDKEPVDLKEMLKTYLQLFILIRDSMENGSDQQKEESLWILGEFYQLVMEESKKLKSNTGLSEQEILSVGNNPNFFTPEQWKAIEETRKKMNSMGMELTDLILKRCC